MTEMTVRDIRFTLVSSLSGQSYPDNLNNWDIGLDVRGLPVIPAYMPNPSAAAKAILDRNEAEEVARTITERMTQKNLQREVIDPRMSPGQRTTTVIPSPTPPVQMPAEGMPPTFTWESDSSGSGKRSPEPLGTQVGRLTQIRPLSSSSGPVVVPAEGLSPFASPAHLSPIVSSTPPTVTAATGSPLGSLPSPVEVSVNSFYGL